jgi:hypothetical protein
VSGKIGISIDERKRVKKARRMDGLVCCVAKKGSPREMGTDMEKIRDFNLYVVC